MIKERDLVRVKPYTILPELAGEKNWSGYAGTVTYVCGRTVAVWFAGIATRTFDIDALELCNGKKSEEKATDDPQPGLF